MTFYEQQIFEKLDIQEDAFEDLQFIGCTFTHCNFYSVLLTNCRFTECTFRSCTAAAITWKICELSDNAFHSCKLVGIDWNMLWRKDGLFLPFTTMDHCALPYNSFVNMKLTNFDFHGSSLQGSQFDRCDLCGAVMSGCDLKDVMFTDNQMNKADLRDAKDYHISLKRNTLKGARFSFPEVLNLLAESGIVIE